MRALRLWLPVLLWTAFILLAANDSLSSSSTRGWFERTFGFPLGFWPHVILRKSGHVFEYAVLAVLAWRASRRLGVAVLVSLAVAIADETKQSFTLARTGSVWDVLLDTCAAFLAALAWRRVTGGTNGTDGTAKIRETDLPKDI